MHARFLATLLLAVALPGAAPAGAGGVVLEVITFPSPWRCPGAPTDPLAAALGVLGYVLYVRGDCNDPRACALAESSLTQAFASACAGEHTESLALAAQAVARFERGGALTTFALAEPAPPPLVLADGTAVGFPQIVGPPDAVRSLVETADELLGERRDEIEDAVEGLCASARSGLERTLSRPERAIEQAQVHAENGVGSSTLRALASAASELDRAEGSIAAKASRCRPPACRSNRPFDFEPGPASNPSLALVPPDRGSVAVYRFSREDGGRLGTLNGTLRMAWSALTQASLQAELQPAQGSFGWTSTGTFKTSACLDPHGWYRYSKLSEAFRSGGGGSLSFAPAAVGVAPLGLVPVVPRALALRVGDHVEQANLQVGGREAGRAVRVACAESHRVVAIEELRVSAGTFEAARVESRFRCANGLDLESVAWLASEVGFARAELHDADSFTRFELECFETAESEGRCAPAAPAASSGSGMVVVVVQPPDSAGLEIQAAPEAAGAVIRMQLDGALERRELLVVEPAPSP